MSRPEFTDENGQEVNVGTKRFRETGGLVDALSCFESAIESIVEDSLLNFLRARGHPVEIAKKLARVMGDETCIWLDGRLVAPDKYVVWLRPKSYSVYNNIFEIMEQNLAEYLQNVAEENKPAIYFLKPPIVKLEAGHTLGRHRILVKAHWGEDNQERQARPQVEQKVEREKKRRPVVNEYIKTSQETNNDIEEDKALPGKLKEALQNLKNYEIVGKIDDLRRFAETIWCIYEFRGFLEKPKEPFKKLKKFGRNKEVWAFVYEGLIEIDSDETTPKDIKVTRMRILLGIANILGIVEQGPNTRAVLADLEARYPVKSKSVFDSFNSFSLSFKEELRSQDQTTHG